MAVPTKPRRKCQHCKSWLEARMVQAARLDWGDLSTVVFAKSLPVLLCPVCDAADPKGPKGPPAR